MRVVVISLIILLFFFNSNKAYSGTLTMPTTLTTDTTDKLMNHPRFDIHIGKNSKITILEHYIGLTNVSYLTNAVSQFNLANNSQLSHIRLQEEDDASHHIGFTRYNIEADSFLKSSFITNGAVLCRNDIKINFTA